MSAPTPKQIDAEIDALQQCLEFAPRFTAFGEDNHASIRVQIEALDDGWDEEKAFEVHGENGEEESPRLLAAAEEAINWRDGNNDEAPSAGWQMYRPKKGGK